MTSTLYADDLPAVFGHLVLFTKKRKLIPAEAGVSLSEILQPCHSKAFDGGSLLSFELGQNPLSSRSLPHGCISY